MIERDFISMIGTIIFLIIMIIIDNISTYKYTKLAIKKGYKYEDAEANIIALWFWNKFGRFNGMIIHNLILGSLFILFIIFTGIYFTYYLLLISGILIGGYLVLLLIHISAWKEAKELISKGEVKE